MVSVASFLLLAGLAVGAAHAACRWMPWSDDEIAVGLRAAVALAIAPLLLGLSAVAALWALPGASHASHLVAMACLLAMAGVPGWVVAWRGRARASAGGHSTVACALLIGYAAVLALDGAMLPLVQNDALEYATVGRILFESRDLASYPAIRPQETASGFYGPWTHPPLYVGLIYAANALQGEAESGRLLRFVAPWCLIAAAWCVGALGRLLNRDRGEIASAIMVSVPLLYLGAAAALIDPLALLGFTVAFTGAVVLSGRGLPGAVAFGLLLGLSLWVHSQAILFPFLLLPLMLLHALRAGSQPSWSRIAASGIVSLAVAAVVGAAPYARNQLLFGSPISDTPVVFALPSLQWAQYFAYQRGFSTSAEIVQYGVLKGLFAPEAYSITFWAALLGIGAAWRASRSLAARSNDPTVAQLIGAGSLWCLAIYVLATIASVALGVDLMVRNERYLLVMVPCAALLAVQAFGNADGGAAPPHARRRNWPFAVLVGVLGAQLIVLAVYRLSQFDRLASLSTEAALAGWAPYRAASYLRERTPPDALVLTMKPADMYYAGRRMLSYLDPRLLRFYAIEDPDAAADELRRLGVTHVHLPDYMLPPVYNSALMTLATDRRHLRLLHDDGGHQVYALLPKPDSERTDAACARSPSPSPWRRDHVLVLGGRKSLLRVPLSSAANELGRETVGWNQTPLFLRESATVMRSPRVRAPHDGEVVTIRLSLSGQGYVAAYVESWDASGHQVERRLIGDRPVHSAGETSIARRVALRPGTAEYSLAVEFRGRSRITLSTPMIEYACDDPVGSSPRVVNPPARERVSLKCSRLPR